MKVSPLIFRLVTVTQTEKVLWAGRAPTLGESLHVDWLIVERRNLKFNGVIKVTIKPQHVGILKLLKAHRENHL